MSSVPGISSYARKYVRERTADRMVDACKIWKPGPPVLDPATGKTKRGPGTTKYEGPCRVWEAPVGSPTFDTQQKLVVTATYLSIPFDAPVPDQDDVVLITKSDDSDLQGRTVSIVSMVRGGGLRASRRFQVRIVTSNRDNW